MNNLKKLLLCTFLAWGASSLANATPITDFVNPTPDITIGTTTPYSYVHNLADQGYDPSLFTITSALLTVHLTDTGGSEAFTFLIGSSGTQQVYTGTNVPSSRNYDINLVAALTDLIVDGMLNVSLSAQSGSYQFADSTLIAEVVARTPAASVPEPASLALLGLGLLGLRTARRRKQ